MGKLLICALALTMVSFWDINRLSKAKPLPGAPIKANNLVVIDSYFDCSGYKNSEPEFLLHVKRSKDQQYVLVDFCGAANDDLYTRPPAGQGIKKTPK